MNPEHLLQHFDRLSEAPDAIARLRRFILNLAVRGKLVEQDPNDEPAAELLKRIQKEQMQLMKEGKLRKTKSLEPIVEGDIDFDIPNHWYGTRLGSIYDVRDGTHDTPKYFDTGYPLITSKNLTSGRLLFDDIKLICEQDYLKISERSFVEKGDILLAMIGSIGNPVVVDTDRPFSIKNVALFKYYHSAASSPGYLCLFLKYATSKMQQLATGGLQPFVSLGFLRSYPIALPPLAEQHRIVAKVDELMALCDRLQAAQTEREKSRDRLVAASLHQLQNADGFTPRYQDAKQDEKAEQENLSALAPWRESMFLQNLPRLTTRPVHIKQLRQTILNLAVRGKLVPQDPNDEPAAELLKRIQAEKAQLLKEGKLKKDKLLPQISEIEKLFVLPKGWEWARMQTVFDVRDGTHDTPKYVESDGIPLITSRNFVDGKISFDDAKLISQSDHNSIKKRSGVERGDILYSMIGGNIGNQVFVDTDREFSIKNVALFKYYAKKHPLPEYLNLFLKTVTISLQNEAVGGAQPFVSLSLLRNIPFPIPPLAEQHRIVAKVDELMALCDQLETQLNTTEADSRRLLEAVLHEALAPLPKETA